MEAHIFNGVGIVFLIVLGFFAVGGLLFGIERLLELRRSGSGTRVNETGRPAESTWAYGPHDCYRDCIKAENPFSEGQHPSCAEACGLST